MTQKKQSKLAPANNGGHEGKLLAKVEAPKIQKAKKKKSSSNTKKANFFRMSPAEELFILSGCLQQKKKKSVPPIHICKGENGSAEEMNVHTAEEMDIHPAEEMDIDQEGIYFPEEIVMDILSRLPVQSLQRFKCISPGWNTLISHHYFILKHLNRTKNDLNSQKLLINRQPSRENPMPEFDRYSFSSSPVQGIEDEQRLDLPPNCKPTFTMRCSCDGLVLLSTSDKSANVMYLLLWNPSTREIIALPSREFALHNLVFGLGYDTTSDDYKILVADLNDTGSSSEEVSVEILPLKIGSWRKIGKYPTGIRRVSRHVFCGMYSLVFIHGAFHWLGKAACYTIISFNISNEVYGEIPLLEWMCDMRTYTLNHGVSVLRGMLCYYSMPSMYQRPYTLKLWAMKDYGVNESWMQLHEIRDINGIDSVVPYYMFADDDVLLRLKQFVRPLNSLFWTSKRGRFELWRECHQIIAYTESLISPKLLI